MKLLQTDRIVTQRNVFTMDNLTVRQATFSDYDGVMGISKGIFRGDDYLPSMYHIYLHDKNANAFVITLNDTIVST